MDLDVVAVAKPRRREPRYIKVMNLEEASYIRVEAADIDNSREKMKVRESQRYGGIAARGPSGNFSIHSANRPRIVGPHISRRIAAFGAHFQPTAGRTYDVDPGPSVDLRDDTRSR